MHLCIKSSNACIQELETPVVSDLIISLENEKITYGETYLFYIKTNGCKGKCTKNSTEIETRSGKINICFT